MGTQKVRGYSRKFRPLEIIGNEEVAAIQNGTMEVLEKTGLRVEHEKALEIFDGHGCTVDRGNNRVRFPAWLVEDCLRKTPASFVIESRDPNKNIRMGGNTTYFGQNASMSLVDIDTWEPTDSTLEQHGDAIRVMDALENLSFLLGYEFYMDMTDVHPVMMMIEGVASSIRNSAKITSAGPSNDAEKFSLEIARVAGTDIILEEAPSPPLTLPDDFCEGTISFAEANMPMTIVSGAVMGGTGPATFAGSNVSNNAEVMAGIVLAQLVKPGSKVLAGDFVYPMNMTTGSPDFGGMGVAMHIAIFNQVWRRYNIPTMSGQAAYSNSKKIDWQNGAEKALMLFASALSGTNYLSIHGAVHGELTWHPIQAVVDDEICGWVGKFLEGTEVNSESLALDLIREIGPIPGHFLNTGHTRKWWKREQFFPKVFDRTSIPEWIKKGKRDVLVRAKERVDELMKTHTPEPPLSPEQDREIDEILKKARSYYKQKGLM
jgi:trimethylamine--corrinoid protein Co-methyltransferase